MFCPGTICIGGLPGIGSVGKVAADYLSMALDAEAVASISSNGFPAQVMVVEGLVHLFQAEVRIPQSRDDLVLICGDAQPLDVKSMYALAGEILDQARIHEAKSMVTLAAYVGDSQHKVLGVASDIELAAKLEESVPLLRNGVIGGLNGLLVGLAPLYGMSGLCLLGSTSGDDPVDLQAASNLLEVLTDLLGLEIPREDLDLTQMDEEDLDAAAHQEDREPFDISYR